MKYTLPTARTGDPADLSDPGFWGERAPAFTHRAVPVTPIRGMGFCRELRMIPKNRSGRGDLFHDSMRFNSPNLSA
jgi:hypothetical protein